MLGLHMSPIHETALLFQAMSPEQKQTTLCVQNPNCTQLCHEVWASQYTLSWNQLCKTDSAFSCPLLKTGVWECFVSKRVNVWAWWGSVCAGNQKFFSSAACSWRFIRSRQGHQLSRSTNPSWDTLGNWEVLKTWRSTSVLGSQCSQWTVSSACAN